MTAEVQALAPEVSALVRRWLKEAQGYSVPKAASQLADVLVEPDGLPFAVSFIDEVIRPEDEGVAAARLAKLGAHPPRFLAPHLKAALKAGALAAKVAPKMVVPAARRVLREMVSHLILDATPSKLDKSLARIREQGMRANLNLLGEAVLGEREAERRLNGTMALLARDDVDYVSLKVSAAVAPTQRWGFQATVAHIVESLRPLFRAAATATTQKFINLDMEEYKDLELTLAVFTRLLDEQEFKSLRAGIVLQAYLPDAMGAMIRLQAWAADRVENGGAPIKVRLVKGANLPMERVEAELHHWPLATCSTKEATDTNYKRVLNFALHPERIRNVGLGVAGHNLFDLALAWLLAQRRGITEGLDFEMLLGMAPGQAKAVQATVGDMVLYVPVVHPAEFDVAIAYLVRRLEEGASSDNFMSAVFHLDQDERLFAREEGRFRNALAALDSTVPPPNRRQNRTKPAAELTSFVPTPDSDPSVLANQHWAEQLRQEMTETSLGEDAVAANEVETLDELANRFDTALASDWTTRTGAQRAAVLHAAGNALERHRADLMVIAGAEAGKTIDQSDPEVSEAIDFAHYYADSAIALDAVDGANHVSPKLIVVTPPWNFPLAIPAGSMMAGLAAGAAVIVKPARVAARCTAVVVEALWEAGVPRDALQLVIAAERSVGSALVSDPRVDRVILTGGYETAELFKGMRPDLQLLAETSGKNAIIVTPHADIDLAVKDVVYSAFGHAGQKCSAASLVVLVGQVARSRRFHNQLLDAVRSLKIGQPHDALAQVGPLITEPSGKLRQGLTSLEPGQSWLVEPKPLDEEGKLWRPGVRTGVARGSEYHKVEYFGPILGIMTAETLDEAIDIVNDVDFGLTSGLHSLDATEIGRWLERIQAGNLYVNRGTTGAIVARQPFGGWKRSVVGATSKAGGPNYLVGLSDWTRQEASAGAEIIHPAVIALMDAAAAVLSSEEIAFLQRSAASDQLAWENEFGQARDVEALTAERNVLRYRKLLEGAMIRAGEQAQLADLLRVALAATRSGSNVIISTAEELPVGIRAALFGAGFTLLRQNEEAFSNWLGVCGPTRVRVVGRLAAWPKRADVAIYNQPVTESGRVEILPFVLEQAVSITAHRFGTPNELTAGLL